MKNGKNHKTDNAKLLLNDFVKPTYEDWRREVTDILKNKAFDETLMTDTYENIRLQPICHEKDLRGLNCLNVLPAAPYCERDIECLEDAGNFWEISQALAYTSPGKLNEAIKQDYHKGLSSISIELDRSVSSGRSPQTARHTGATGKGTLIFSIADMEKALADIDLRQLPIHINPGLSFISTASLLAALAGRKNIELTALQGSIDADPLRELISEGELPVSLDQFYDEMYLVAGWAVQNKLKLKTISIDGSLYHDAGASVVEELAFSLATAVEYLRQMEIRGLDINAAAPLFRFSFRLGSQFFIEIARLRAARIIWAKIIKVGGGNNHACKIIINGQTSIYNKNVYDPYVNMLRATAEASAAIFGGCDSLLVGCYDETFRTPDEFSRRIARNVQLILKHESHIDKVIDPAGGSWHVESLTDAIARKTWQLFRDVEEKGGLLKALQTGFVQETIAKTNELRKNNLAELKDIMVGINMYPDSQEKYSAMDSGSEEANVPDRSTHSRSKINSKGKNYLQNISKMPLSSTTNANDLFDLVIEAISSGSTIEDIDNSLCRYDTPSISVKPLIPYRIAELFEHIRQTVDDHSQKSGNPPTVFMANLGRVSQHKSRSAFAANFFQIGGFRVLNNDNFNSATAAAESALKAKAQVVAICSSDELYPEFVPSLARAIKSNNPDIIIVLAGYPEAYIESFEQAGVDEFIFKGVDVPEMLKKILHRLGVLS
jgi:methylmalonyl-CoA mutase